LDTIKIDRKKVNIVEKADVVVAGAGPAGIGAALAAARKGARTVILEREFALGGMMTTGLMSKIAISSYIKGIAREIIKKLEEQNMSLPAGEPEIPIDPEATKHLLDNMLQKEKINIMLGSQVTGAIKENNKIKAAVIENKSGCQAVMGSKFIDATGDGDLSKFSGANFESGRKKDGLGSAPTLMFRIFNVDYEKVFEYIKEHPEDLGGYRDHTPEELYEKYYGSPQEYTHLGRFPALIEKLIAQNDYSEWEKRILTQRDGILFFNQPQPNHVLVNATRITGTDCVNAKQLSEAMIEGRKQAHFIHSFLKKHVPGFENSFIGDTAEQMGVRESRRIMGDYMLTRDDVLEASHFEDAVLKHSGGIEIHNPQGQGTEFVKTKPGSYYEIPYRSILVKGFSNLMVAGRCFSASHSALSASRSIGFCLGLGESAGTAAAVAANNSQKLRNVDINSLQQQLASY